MDLVNFYAKVFQKIRQMVSWFDNLIAIQFYLDLDAAFI